MERKKRNGVVMAALAMLTAAAVFIAGCGGGNMKQWLDLLLSGAGEKVVGKNIAAGDITDFYFTRENINYNADYQRYRFYREDGKCFFFHETRERPDEYGPTTEDDRTAYGTAELTDGQWKAFFDHIAGGKVTKRSDSAESGDSGPWMYLYWSGDKGEIQEYSFASYADQGAFERFCEELRDTVTP